MQVKRRAIGPNDVLLDGLYCGTDIHTVRYEWRATLPTAYPSVPGHEIIGRVQVVGALMKGLNEVFFVIQIITVGVLGHADPGIVVDRLGCCQQDELAFGLASLVWRISSFPIPCF
jgi:threonine dehydrogenase-like Zn-dependent dehydrogenase